MPNPLIVGLIVFAVLLAGAFAGWTTKQRLPKHHLTDETKNVVSVSMAVVATVPALVLGLLISNANTKFSVLEGEVTALSAEILRLDQILRRYGPDTNPAREILRQYAEQKTADLFPKDGKCAPRQSIDIRVASAARGFAACNETCNSARPLVARTGYESCC